LRRNKAIVAEIDDCARSTAYLHSVLSSFHDLLYQIRCIICVVVFDRSMMKFSPYRQNTLDRQYEYSDSIVTDKQRD